MCDFNEQVQQEELMGSFSQEEPMTWVKILLTPKRMISAVYEGDRMIACKGVTAKVEPIELDQLKVTLCNGTQLFFDRNDSHIEFMEEDDEVSDLDRFSQPIHGETEESDVVAVCVECTSEIYRGEDAKEMANGDVVHKDCFVAYAEKELEANPFIPKDEVNG
jgi:hypothetical protein